MLIRVNGGARLTLNAAVTLSGALQVYNGAELNICAALTNEAYGNVAGVERGLCVFAGGTAMLAPGGKYAGDGTRRVYGSMDGFCHAETEAELNAALSSGANTVHVSQDAIVAVNGAVSIQRGVTLKLLSGARLSIADGALLINTFRGLNGGIDDPALAGAREGELLAQYRKTAEEICGRKLEISGGSSPTGKYVAQSGQADEIRPGTYVFSDYMMYKECGAPLENVSARLVVTVVSVHKDYVVVDGGCKTFATDPQLDQPPYFFEGYAWFPQYPELRIRRLTEEHGMVTAEGPMPELKVGDMLEAIPVHICPTVNLQNQIYVADGGVLRTEIVAGRGKLQ